jgi:tetratricopeptide (TPR) repeat protein
MMEYTARGREDHAGEGKVPDSLPIDVTGHSAERRITDRRIVAFICIFLAAATLYAYWHVQSFPFVLYDDPLYILDNKIVKQGLTAQGLVSAFSSFTAANWHPLTLISHMADVQLYGLNAAGHHWTSVVIHTVNTVLLFLVLRAMTLCTWPSALVAALFALHPLHVESVAWVAERKDVLSAFFWFAAMGAYLGYVRQLGPWRYGLVLLLFSLGLLSKPMLVTFPFFLMLLDYWPLNRYVHARTILDRYWPAQNPSAWQAFSRLAAEKIPLFLLSVISSILTLLAQKGGGAFISIQSLPIKLRLANALDSCFGYLSKMIIPVNMAFYYPMGREILFWQIAIYAILLVLITILVIAAMRRYPFLFVGWFWYVGTLVPVIGIVQVGTQAMADRYTYVPLIGIFIMAAWGMKSIADKYSWAKSLFSTISIALIPVLIVMTGQQAMIWRDSETLFTHALVVTERNPVAHNNLAAVYLESGRLQEAIPHIRRALEISPFDAQANGNMGAAFFMQQKYEDAERHLMRALEVEPSNVSFQVHLATILANVGKEDQAKQLFEGILQRYPERDDALLELSLIYSRSGNYQEALQYLSKAARINPGHPVIRYQYGRALMQTGRVAEAVEHLHAASVIWPNQAEFITALEEARLASHSKDRDEHERKD